MDPSDYRERYLPQVSPAALTRPRATARGAVLPLVDKYFPDHDRAEPYVDMLGRSALLRLIDRCIERCGVTPANQRITGTKVLAGIQVLLDRGEQKQIAIDRLSAELAQWKAEADRLQTEFAKREKELSKCWGKHEKLSNDIVELHAILADVYASTSWRITRPIRWLRSILRH